MNMTSPKNFHSRRYSDQEYVFQGNIDLDDFNELMGTEIEKDMADTLGGLMYGLMAVCRWAVQVELDGVQLTVEHVIGRRIHKVRAKKVEQHQTEETDEE